MLRAYYQLIKPGIIRGNVITTIGGFLLGANGNVNLWLLLATVAGLSGVIASACVVNNYLDRSIDEKMKRTKSRALVTGVISLKSALVFAAILGIAGLGILIVYTNPLTSIIALFGFIAYVVLYGIAKRKTVYGTIIGSISGAVPIVVGYTAATRSLDALALLLFAILVVWQMPHFYAIALYRLNDYKAAKLPVLPAVKGGRVAKIRSLVYIAAFIIATTSLTLLGYTGITYLIVMLIVGVAWLVIGARDYRTLKDEKWGRSVFGFSLLVIGVFSLMISIDTLLP